MVWKERGTLKFFVKPTQVPSCDEKNQMIERLLLPQNGQQEKLKLNLRDNRSDYMQYKTWMQYLNSSLVFLSLHEA